MLGEVIESENTEETVPIKKDTYLYIPSIPRLKANENIKINLLNGFFDRALSKSKAKI